MAHKSNSKLTAAKPASRASASTPTSSSTTGSTAGANTRGTRTQQATGPMSREDAISRAPGDIKTLEKSMAYLSDKAYVPDAASLSLQTISFILFQIAAMSHSATDSNGIKAVAFLLEEIDIHGISETLADRIGAKIDEKINDYAQRTLEVREQDAMDYKDAVEQQRQELEAVRREVSEAVKLITKGKEDLEATQNSLENAVGEIAEVLSTSLRDITEQANIITSPESYTAVTPTSQHAAAPITTQTPHTDAFSYAAVTRTHLPSTHATNITKNNDKRRQFTILPATSESDMGLTELTELEIVAKLTLAYETMTVGKEAAPSEIRFSGVRRMRKGGIVFELNSDAAADWLRNEENQTDFTRHFSATATVHGYQFRVMAEFVPVSFNAEAAHATRNIEEANYLPTGCIAEIGWIKKIERRSSTQHVAHLKISFTTIEQANNAIEKGLSVQGKWVNVRQMIVEPQRCAKCQLYGHDNNKGAPHFARDCKWAHDVCGLCGGMHRTSACTASMPDRAQCANCRTSGNGEYRGHTVHSRSCPTFLDMKNRYEHKHGSQQYRFFVTEDTKTWETPNNMAPAQTFSQGSQYYPAPPPNQLQRPNYPHPENVRQTPTQHAPRAARAQRFAETNTARPRGMQVSASNSVPIGRTTQGKLNRWLDIAETLNEDDATDKEIEANGLTGRITPVTAVAVELEATAMIDGTPVGAWADDTSTGLPSILTSPTQSTTSTSTGKRSSRASTPATTSSPLRFPSTRPTSPTAASVSV